MSRTVIREQPDHEVRGVVPVRLVEAHRRETSLGVRLGRLGQHLPQLTLLFRAEHLPPRVADHPGHPTGCAAPASAGCASLILRRAILPLAIRLSG